MQWILKQLRTLVIGNGDPVLDVIGIAPDGQLPADIDAELYAANPS
jgi:hypothetical protein